MKVKISPWIIVTALMISITTNLYAQVSQKALDEHKKKWDTPAWTDTLKNPFSHSPTVASDSGKALYMKICSVCHGNGGKGDGIAAAGLSVQPANNTSEMVQTQTDGSLFYELSNGHAPMPPYKTILSEKQRWQLICFIRSLKLNPKK